MTTLRAAGQVTWIPRLIIILVLVAAAARWEPATVLPMILGIALCSWLLARRPAAVTVL